MARFSWPAVAWRLPSAAFIGAHAPRITELTPAALEVLACVAFKQPVSQSEIDRLFGDVDKRHLVFVLREAEMVEEFVGDKGRLLFATTGKFLRHFGLANVGELKVALQDEQTREAQGSFMGFLTQ